MTAPIPSSTTTQVTKVCTRCQQEKSLDQFSFKNKRTGKRQARCKACQADYHRQHYQANKSYYKHKARTWEQPYLDKIQRFIIEYLLEHPCVDCGESNPLLLDFDHVRGEKLMEVSVIAIRMHSIKKIKAEIAKCEVRCANCHRRKTARDHNYYSVRFGENEAK